MIIECERCGAKFNLDEGLLRDEGTKLRCSQCKHVFKAYPAEKSPEEPELMEIEGFEPEATVETPPGSGLEMEEQGGPIYMDLNEAFAEEPEASPLKEALQRPGREREREKAGLEKGLERVSRPAQVGKGKAKEAIPAKPQKAARPPAIKKHGRSAVLPVILIVILLLLGGGAAVYFFAPRYIPESLVQYLPFLKVADKPDPKDPGVRRLSFRAITGNFAQSSSAGQLFIIKGMVVNNYSGSRSSILIKGSILDDKGKVVKTKLAYAGNTFTDNEIKELTVERISQAMRNKPGKGNMNTNIKPQVAVPFMVIFEELPENLSEFTVEAVSSAPGE
jgi:predicted Zn finger-like uncharacterized protein